MGDLHKGSSLLQVDGMMKSRSTQQSASFQHTVCHLLPGKMGAYTHSVSSPFSFSKLWNFGDKIISSAAHGFLEGL